MTSVVLFGLGALICGGLARAQVGETNAEPRERRGVFLSLLLDRSNSTDANHRFVLAVGRDLVERLDESRDLGSVVAFGARYDALAEITSNRRVLAEAVMSLEPARETTSLYNALYLSSKVAAQQDGARQRVVVVVTDGEDTSSRVTREDVVESARSADMQIFAVLIGTTRRIANEIREMTDATGGAVFRPTTADEAREACDSIAEAIGLAAR